MRCTPSILVLVSLLGAGCVHEPHPMIVARPSSDTEVHRNLASMLGCHVDAISDEKEPERSQYLGDATTPEPIRTAIEQGRVVEGMCPLQAFAAAGRPGPYMVARDRSVWPNGASDPEIISAQCERPDASKIHLVFRNAGQFPESDAPAFRVRFERGRAVHIQPLVPDCPP